MVSEPMNSNPQVQIHSFVESAVCSLLRLLHLFSLANLRRLVPHRFAHLFMELYVLTWATYILAVLFTGLISSRIAVIVVLYRIVDIVVYRLYFFFVKSAARPWTNEALRRSVLLALINCCEVIMAFAVVYLVRGSEIANAAGNGIRTPMQALYFSTVTMLTVGFGDFVPATDASRGIVLLQLASVALLVLLLVPALISAFSTVLSSDAPLTAAGSLNNDQGKST
jgi:hypothetical protein